VRKGLCEMNLLYSSLKHEREHRKELRKRRMEKEGDKEKKAQ